MKGQIRNLKKIKAGHLGSELLQGSLCWLRSQPRSDLRVEPGLRTERNLVCPPHTHTPIKKKAVMPPESNNGAGRDLRRCFPMLLEV